MRHYCITGGIGAGKSYVCRRLESHGASIYDCDSNAKRLLNNNEGIRTAMKRLIGDEAYNADGTLNKPVVARFLLASEENKQRINAIVHPAVMDDFYRSGMQWMESAILYEAHLEHYVDSVVAVTAPAETRIRRIMQRDGITYDKAKEWLDKQADQEEVANRADHVITNDGTADVDKQIEDILERLRAADNRANSQPSQVKSNNKQINHNTNMQKTILAISGKPGLYELVSRAKANLIVEALDGTHRRMPAFASDRVTSLADIAMYTDEEDLPLMNIMSALRDMEGGKKSSINWRKASATELQEYFARFVPNFDRERVHNSDIKKLLQWYDILVEAGITNFEEVLKPTNGDNIDDRIEA